ncbi:hypothetical protein D6D12_00511 [Aureobasidium pullulans]|uniref:Zn(2)-C6 fungal-type domain-containing protein n=1 Tax=Aureobasidium pullulans TaxID=5580 RepID=A0AB74K689_AURPU|nr:hypothetical protein D6D12_00511 [Aureobasidium pullulans]THX53180.1 hypothetical protein D6D11_04526 [Aureobasidium pullulans]
MAAAVAIQPLAPRSGPMAFNQQQPRTITSSRGRRERPCDGCRRRKSKCVLQDSLPCVLCEFHKQDCTFVEAAQPRKRKIDDSAGLKDTPNAKRPKDSKSPGQTPPPQQHTIAPVIHVEKPQHAPQPVRGVVLGDTLSLQREQHCRLIGRTSALDISLLGFSDFGSRHETNTGFGKIRRVATSDFFSMHTDAAFSTYEDELQTLVAVEQTVAPYGPALIDLYFRNVHPSFPILQKHTFMDRHRNGDRQFHSGLLAGMYLLALRWWNRDPVLSQHPKPSVYRLEELAARSLSMAMQHPKLSALQAGLLLLQRRQATDWGLTVQLVALGQDLGLHIDCTNWDIPIWERRLRKRLAWALYMQDKWTALVHGRPSHIQASDWAVSALSLDDFNEEFENADQQMIADDENEEEEKSRVIFIQMIELTSIMAEVIDVFYTQRANAEFERGGRNATRLILERAKPVQLKLKEWFSKLPSVARMDAYTPGKLSSNGYLHLAYFATEISIHRRIVQSLQPSTTDPYVLYICRSAAKTRLISAMDFVNRLKPEHLDSFWYFASATNFALINTFGNLLRATAPGEEEAGFYSCRLKEYRWALGASCRRAEWLEGAVRMLDATDNLVDGLGDRQRNTQQHTINEEMDEDEDEGDY